MTFSKMFIDGVVGRPAEGASAREGRSF